MQTSLALFQRIFEYLDLPVDITEPAEPVRLAKVRGEVAFEKVEFHYDPEGAGRPTLDSIDLTVPAGGSLAVVGPTGSGKSTLSYLVPRLYDVTGGRVTLDGVDVRDLDFDTLARAVGVVSQETYLFHASVADNLRFAKPDATDEEIEAAARAAQIHDHIASLPEGYDTLVGERGYRFSGGEKQRLAIARTILRDPPVLILDEATSALDTRTEHAVQQAIDALSALPHHDHHRPPALHRPRRRPDRRPGGGPDRGARHARRAAGPGREVRGPGPAGRAECRGRQRRGLGGGGRTSERGSGCSPERVIVPGFVAQLPYGIG